MIEASQWTLKKTLGEVTWHVEKASNNVYPRNSLENRSSRKLLFFFCSPTVCLCTA